MGAITKKIQESAKPFEEVGLLIENILADLAALKKSEKPC